MEEQAKPSCIREYFIAGGPSEKSIVPDYPAPYAYNNAVGDILKYQARPADVQDLVMLVANEGGKFRAIKGHWVSTVSGIAYGDEKLSRFKVIPRSEDLIQLGRLELITTKKAIDMPITTSSYYESILNPELRRSDLILGRELTEEEALEHAIWKTVVPDTKVLEKFIETVYRKIREEGRMTCMGIYLPNPLHPDERPEYDPKEFPKGMRMIRPLSMVGPDLMDDSIMTKMCQMVAIIEGTPEEVKRHKKAIRIIRENTIVMPDLPPLFGEHYPDKEDG